MAPGVAYEGVLVENNQTDARLETPEEPPLGAVAPRRKMLLTAVALAGAVAVVDLLLGPDTALVGLLVAAPLVAAAGANRLDTAVVAVSALLLGLLLGALEGTVGASSHAIALLLVAVAGALAVWLAALGQRRQRAVSLLAAQSEVRRLLAESDALADAAPAMLRSLGEALGWELGALWVVDHRAGELRCVEAWHAPSRDLAGFEELSRRTPFALGVGLPGRVWQSGEPAWIVDAPNDPNFPRAEPAAVRGLCSAFAFPVRDASEVLGVIEFFTRQTRRPDDELLDAMSVLGGQIGQHMERLRFAKAARAT